MRARLDVGALPVGTRQVFLDEAQTLERDAIRKRMEPRRAIGLEAMGERVEAGGGGEEGGRPTVVSGSAMTVRAA